MPDCIFAVSMTDYRSVGNNIAAIRKKVMILKSKVKDIEREGVMGQMSKNQAFWGLGRD
jgi:hypothetical protein